MMNLANIFSTNISNFGTNKDAQIRSSRATKKLKFDRNKFSCKK